MKPTCRDCRFYENDCPHIRGKFIPYPNRVCEQFKRKIGYVNEKNM